MSTVLSAKNVVKTFGSGKEAVQALKGVDIDITAGEFVAIVGKSGSGKSTLLYCLCGLLGIDSGVIDLAGHKISAVKAAELAKIRRDNLGFIFQDLNLISSLNVADNVRLPAKLAGKNPSKREVQQALKDVGLLGAARKMPDQLSGGQRQRVAIARALVRKPALLFADEPTGSLDVNTSAQVMELLRGTVSATTTLVMVTHDLDIAATADRVVVLSDGANHQVLHKPNAQQLFEVLHKSSSMVKI